MKCAATMLCLLLTATALAPHAMAQSIVLDPDNPFANFLRHGDQTRSVTPGASILMTDADPNNHIGFYAATSVAAPGNVVDLTATFRIQQNDQPSGVDTGMRLYISDGAVTSFIVGCIYGGGMPGLGIAIGQNFGGGENYGAFVPVDWINQVTVTLRRHADGSGEIVEVNGAAPLVSALVPPWSMPGPILLAAPHVGFGLFSDPAVTTIEMMAFSATVTPVPEPETYALMLAGLGLLGITARRRKQKAAAAA